VALAPPASDPAPSPSEAPGPPIVEPVHDPAALAAWEEPPDPVHWDDPYEADHEIAVALHGLAGLADSD
jgi:hypothetical protein